MTKISGQAAWKAEVVLEDGEIRKKLGERGRWIVHRECTGNAERGMWDVEGCGGSFRFAGLPPRFAWRAAEAAVST